MNHVSEGFAMNRGFKIFSQTKPQRKPIIQANGNIKTKRNVQITKTSIMTSSAHFEYMFF